MKLAGLWKLPQYRDEIEAVAKGDGGLAERMAGIEAVALYADGRAKMLLGELSDDKEKTESARGIVTLIGLDPASAGEKAFGSGRIERRRRNRRRRSTRVAAAAPFSPMRSKGKTLPPTPPRSHSPGLQHRGRTNRPSSQR